MKTEMFYSIHIIVCKKARKLTLFFMLHQIFLGNNEENDNLSL